MAALTKDQWSDHDIHSSHTLVKRYAEETGQVGLYLSKSVNDGARYNMGVTHGWIVVRPGFRTDSEGTHREPNKVFHVHGAASWEVAFEQAVEWITNKYGHRGVGSEFVAIPGFGRDRFPIEVARWAKTFKPKESTS